MGKRTLLGGAALAALLLTTGAASADSLRDALASAYNSNPTLQAQRAALRATDENMAQANSAFRPTVQALGSYGKRRQDPGGIMTDFNGDPVVDPDTGDVIDNDFSGTQKFVQGTVQQSLFSGFQNWNGRKAAGAQVKAGRAQLDLTEQQMLLDAVTSYMDVLRDESTLELNENNVQVLGRQLEASQDRFRVGEITRTDVAQSEARLAGAVSSRINAEANLAASRATYASVVGNNPGTLEDPPALPPLPESIEAAFEISRGENPRVEAARETERAAYYQVKQAEGRLLPTVGAQLQYQFSSSPFQQLSGAGQLESQTWSAGVQMTVPLYSGGATYSQIRQAKQINSQRRLEVLGAERRVMAEVQTAWQRYRAAVASIASTEAQVRANEIALEGVRQEAAVGSRTTLDVLDAEQELLNSRVNLVRAGRDEYVAGFALLSSVGRLNAVALDLPVEVYDPIANYDKVKWKMIGWGKDS